MRNPQQRERRAIVITHMGAGDRLVDLPWIEDAYGVDASDWIVLPAEDWRAAAGYEVTIWEALERKLLIGFYLNEPELIAVIGHPGGRDATDPIATGQREIRRIVRRVRALLLPTKVVGIWAHDDRRPADAYGLEESPAGEHHWFTPEREPAA